MPQIPTVPGSYRVNTPDAGVKMDFGTLNQPNVAAGNMGRAVGEVGREVGGFALQLQQAKNFGVAADADRQMRQAAADFQASRVGRTDEENWGNEWKEKSDQLWSGLQDTLPIGPDLKKQLTVNFKNWQSANAIEVQTIANRQRINRAVDRIGLDADEAAKDGGPEAAAHISQVFDGAVHHQLMLPEVAEKMKRQYMGKVDRYAADRFIAANPIAGEEHLMETDAKGKYVNFPHLDDNTRVTLAFQAHRFAQMKMADTATGFFTQRQAFLNQDPGEGIPDVNPDDVRQAVASGYMTASAAKAYLKPPKPSFDPKAAAELKQEIMSTDFTTSQGKVAEFEYMAKIAGVAAGNTEAMQRLKETLNRKLDPKSSLNSPDGKDAVEIINDSFKKGLYGEYEKTIPADDKDPNAKPKTVTDPKAYASAREIQQRNLDAVDEFLHKHPDATREETFKFLSSLNEKPVAQKGAQIFGGQSSPVYPKPAKPNITKEEYDALKPGDSYNWNGKQQIKK
jgi:hypothetical protein